MIQDTKHATRQSKYRHTNHQRAVKMHQVSGAIGRYMFCPLNTKAQITANIHLNITYEEGNFFVC